MNTISSESKGICQRCGRHFVFPSQLTGQDFDCPHCGKQTTLKSIIPNVASALNPWRLVTLVLLLAGVALFFAYTNFHSPKATPLATLPKYPDLVHDISAIEVVIENCNADKLIVPSWQELKAAHQQFEIDLKTHPEISSSNDPDSLYMEANDVSFYSSGLIVECINVERHGDLKFYKNAEHFYRELTNHCDILMQKLQKSSPIQEKS